MHRSSRDFPRPRRKAAGSRRSARPASDASGGDLWHYGSERLRSSGGDVWHYGSERLRSSGRAASRGNRPPGGCEVQSSVESIRDALETAGRFLRSLGYEARDIARPISCGATDRRYTTELVFVLLLLGYGCYGGMRLGMTVLRLIRARLAMRRCHRRAAMLQREADAFAERIAALSSAAEPDRGAEGEAVADFARTLRRIEDEESSDPRSRLRRDRAWARWLGGLDAGLCPRGLPDGAPEPAGAGRGGPPRFPGLRRGAPIRRLCHSSLSKPPTGDELLEQWKRAHGRGRVEEKIRLGSMLLDIEATVDSSLLRNRDGEIVGRNAGVKGWLKTHCTWMLKHYAMLMSCRRLAFEFREAHGAFDPVPAAALLPGPETLPERVRGVVLPMRREAAALLASPESRCVKAMTEELRRRRERRRRFSWSGQAPERPEPKAGESTA